jgi:hypothetical protein
MNFRYTGGILGIAEVSARRDLYLPHIHTHYEYSLTVSAPQRGEDSTTSGKAR